MPNIGNRNGCHRERNGTQGLSPGLEINTLMLKTNFLNSIPVIYKEVPQKGERCRVRLRQNKGIEKWRVDLESSSTLVGVRTEEEDLVSC